MLGDNSIKIGLEELRVFDSGKYPRLDNDQKTNEEEYTMDSLIRVCKPNMANLPAELGHGIITRILKTPKPDYSKMQEEATKIEKEIIEIMEKENANTDSTK